MIKHACTLALLAADAFAIYTCAEWLASGYSSGHEQAVGAWVFIIVAMSAYFAPGIFAWFGASERFTAAAIAVGAVAVIYLLVRIAVGHNAAFWQLGWTTNFMTDPNGALRDGRYYIIGAAFLVIAWVRGSVRAHDEVELDMVSRRVAIPFTIVTIVVIFGAATGRSGEIARGGIAFYAAEVVALACSQLAMTGATVGEVRAGGVVAALLGATAGLVAALFVVCALGVLYLGPIVGPIVGTALDTVLTIVLTPFAWLLNSIFKALFGGNDPFKQLNPQALTIQGGQAKPETTGHGAWYDTLLFVLRGLLFVAIIAATAAVIWFAVRLRRRVRNVRRDDQALGSSGSFGRDLRSVFGAMFSRSPARSANHEGISKLYLEVLAKGEDAARPKLAGETAAEFAPVLSQAFQTNVTDDITRAFEQARYAGREPDTATLRALQEQWKAVR